MDRDQEALYQLSQNKDKWEKFKKDVECRAYDRPTRGFYHKHNNQVFENMIGKIADNMVKSLGYVEKDWEAYDTAITYARNFLRDLMENDVLCPKEGEK